MHLHKMWLSSVFPPLFILNVLRLSFKKNHLYERKINIQRRVECFCTLTELVSPDSWSKVKSLTSHQIKAFSASHKGKLMRSFFLLEADVKVCKNVNASCSTNFFCFFLPPHVASCCCERNSDSFHATTPIERYANSDEICFVALTNMI